MWTDIWFKMDANTFITSYIDYVSFMFTCLSKCQNPIFLQLFKSNLLKTHVFIWLPVI